MTTGFGYESVFRLKVVVLLFVILKFGFEENDGHWRE